MRIKNKKLLIGLMLIASLFFLLAGTILLSQYIKVTAPTINSKSEDEKFIVIKLTDSSKAQDYKIAIYKDNELIKNYEGEEINNIFLTKGTYGVLVFNNDRQSVDSQIFDELEIIVTGEEVDSTIYLTPFENKQEPIEDPKNELVDLQNPLNECEGFVINRGFTPIHKGIDLAKIDGCVVNSAGDGEVITAEYDTNGVSGLYIEIDHGNGLITVYRHAKELYVVNGQKVRKGEKIMYMGSTGNATGSHLHFEVKQDGELKDPYSYIF